MAKINLEDITSGYGSTTTINANNAAIEAAMENTLSRDGTSPNTMASDLDMNSYAINNLPDAVSNQQPVTLGQANQLASVENPLTRDTVGATLYPITTAETAAGVTPTYYYYPPGNVKRYGAAGNGSTDDTSAFQDCHDVLLQTPGLFYIPDGTYAIKGFDWSADDCTIVCDGIIKHANQTTGYLMKIEDSGSSVFRLTGNLRFDSGTTGAALSGTVSALKIAALVESELVLSIEGFTYGIDGDTTAGVGYNNFHLTNMKNCERAIYIHPGVAGYFNRNNFYGGRFSIGSGVTYADQWGIYIEDSGTNTPNDNQFYSPSFEGKGAMKYDEGNFNNVHWCRIEPFVTGTAGTDFADPFIECRGAQQTRFECAYTDQMSTLTKDLGACTRVDDYRFTIDASGDFTEYLYRGARAYVTVSGTTYECSVLVSSEAASVTTVTIMQPFITASPTALKVQLVKVADGTEADFFFANDDIAGVADASWHVRQRLLEHRVRSHLFLESFSNDWPALQLHPGSSDGNDVLRVVDLNRTVTASLDGNGLCYVSRFAVGDETTPRGSQAHITDANEAHAISGSGADAGINAALDALGGKINAVLARLETFGFSSTS